jgi:hypothetical protein
MTDPCSRITFDEWAIDVTCAKMSGAIAFVPICGNEVVWGLTMIQDRAPGPLVGVVSQNGIEEAQRWAAENPNWKIDYCRESDLTEATVSLTASQKDEGDCCDLDGFLPFWAIGKTKTPCVGAQLCTRNGRRCGNAVITALVSSKSRSGQNLWELTTDAGNVIRVNDDELAELFYEPKWVVSVRDSPAFRARQRRGGSGPRKANIIKAELSPLHGKHYGSRVSVFLGDDRIGEIKVWFAAPPGSSLGCPSTRDLAKNDYSSIEVADSDCHPCDCHYESELDYRIAKAIEKALNELDLDKTLS